MAKFCVNCGNQLDENASMCLNCGYMIGGNNNSSNNSNNSGDNKKKGLPTWAIVLIVVGCVLLIPLIIFIAIFVFTFNAATNIIDEVKDKVENITESREIIGTIDDTLENDDIRITLNDVLMYSSLGDNTPAAGKEYLVFFFDVENLDDESLYLSSYSFDGYVDGYSVQSKFIYDSIDGYEEISSTLAPGKNTSGYVLFEVDTTWENLEIRYNEIDLDFEDTDYTFIFKVVNSNE